MNPGKTLRMNALFPRGDGRTVIVAIDHGGIAGPIEGIGKPAPLLKACVDGGADAILTTRGFVRASIGEWRPSLALVLRLTGGFTVLSGRFEEEMISSPETALSLAADTCERWGMPLMIEAMAKGKDMKSTDPAGVKLAARAAQEIGADIVKSYYTGDPESFRKVVEGCPVPVVILGGEKTDSLVQVFTEVCDCLQAGAAGIAIGRNIWQHANPRAMVEAMVGVVHEGWTVKQALAHL
jgi:DhnA family fructose-bisphosphate aldolase class Ia